MNNRKKKIRAPNFKTFSLADFLMISQYYDHFSLLKITKKIFLVLSFCEQCILSNDERNWRKPQLIEDDLRFAYEIGISYGSAQAILTSATDNYGMEIKKGQVALVKVKSRFSAVTRFSCPFSTISAFVIYLFIIFLFVLQIFVVSNFARLPETNSSFFLNWSKNRFL